MLNCESVTGFSDTAFCCQYTTAAEAAAEAVRVILRLCEESKTVKRVIHTASVTAASPLTESSSATTAVYKTYISESCWTTPDINYPLRNPHFDVSGLVLQTETSEAYFVIKVTVHFVITCRST
jgi:hypothetical protein